MGDDFVLAQNQVLLKTPGEPLSETEPKSETTAVLSSDTNLSPAPEDFGSSYDSHVPTKQRQECEADTSDANASDSDWDTIDEDTLEETVDDDSASDRTTEDDETSEADSEDENASEWKHFRPTWDEGDDLVAWASDNMDPDSVIPAQFMRAMGKMYQKRGKYEMAESLLRMAQDELDRIAGRLHEYTLDTVFSLAAVLSHLGKLDEAGKLARRAVQGYLKAKGPENATTLRVLGEISRAYSAVCRQLLQHDPPANSEERRQVSRHTDMYISICQEVPLSAVSIMLGDLGSVLALAGHPANANLAFQWKYDRSADLARRWPPGYKEDVYGDEFHSWLRDVAKEVQGINAGLSSSDPFLIGGEETPAEALSTYLMQHVTAELTREFMGISLSGESDPIRVTTDSVQTWVQDTINNIPSWDPLFGTSSSTETVLASLTRHVIAKTIQDEDLWNSLAGLWKYNPNYPPNQQEVPSIEGLATRLMAEARPAKETIPRESSPPTTSFVTISDSLYDTLPLNEGGTLIRLLELLPGDTDEPLVCNLVVANMLDTPVYEAVSYTWGIDAGLTQEAAVRVNNIRLQVTPNLHACLIALRYPDASRMLWVDAICINQKDDDEKSEQVARMTTIYSSASHVLVYLGDGDEVDEAFFRYFNRERKDGESFQAILGRLGLHRRDIFAGLFALCGREWWTRIWIQQEFALSPTDPTFCVGHLRTQALPLIQDVLEILPQTSGMVYEPEMGRWNLSSRLSQRTRQVINCLGIRSWFEEGSKNLNTILSMTPLSKCSDPRDLIFGRYIFMKPMLRAVFKPDYSLTTESLFEMVAIWLLKIEIGMEIFWLYPSRLSSNSPSWVPDFTKPAANFSFSFPPARERGWRAEGQADDPLDIDCGVLKVYARPLDTISHVFRVGYVPVPELVGQVLFLEQSLLMLAEQDPPHRRHFLSRVLPGLNAKLHLQYWAPGIGEGTSIYGCLPIGEVSWAVERAAGFVVSQIPDSYDRFLSILSHQERHGSRTIALLCEFTKACSRFVQSFIRFHELLQSDHLIELFWASLCDLKNLIGRIKDLKTPRESSSTPSWARQHVTGLMNQMIKQIHVSDDPSPVATENDSTERPLSSSSPEYEEIQATISDCQFEEEVHLRARFVVHLAKLFKSSVDADGEWIRPPGQFADEEEKQVPRLKEEISKDWYRSPDRLSAIFYREPPDFFYKKAPTWIAAERLDRVVEVPHRTIFVTEQRLVGVGRTGVTDIRVGDELVMLENAVFPMVIRPQELGFHEIVGYANIHGLDGDAFHRLGQEQKPPRRVFKFK